MSVTRPTVQDLMARHGITRVPGDEGMSTSKLAKIMSLGELSKGDAALSLGLGHAIGKALGLTARGQETRTFREPYPLIAPSVAAALAGSRAGLSLALDTRQGCFFEGTMPADIFSVQGAVAFDVHDLGEGGAEVVGTSVVFGQRFDWGKGRGYLRQILDRAAEFAQRL